MWRGLNKKTKATLLTLLRHMYASFYARSMLTVEIFLAEACLHVMLA